MLIRTDIARLHSLSARLKRLENELSQISNQLTRSSKMTAQSVKYRSSDYQIRRACDKVIASVNSVNKASRIACDRIYNQSRLLDNAVNSYQTNDSVDTINKGALYGAGANLRGFFANASGNGYSSKMPDGLVGIIASIK